MMKEHRTTTRVRYSEVDGMGIVHHSRYFLYFEHGRTELLREAGHAYRSLEESDRFLVVTETRCRHRSPAFYDDLLDVRTRVLEVGHVRVTFGYRLFRGETLVAEGETTLACLDSDRHPVPVPPEIRNALRVWLDSTV